MKSILLPLNRSSATTYHTTPPPPPPSLVPKPESLTRNRQPFQASSTRRSHPWTLSAQQTRRLHAVGTHTASQPHTHTHTHTQTNKQTKQKMRSGLARPLKQPPPPQHIFKYQAGSRVEKNPATCRPDGFRRWPWDVPPYTTP